MKSAALLAVLQFVSIFVVTLSMRYCAKGKIAPTIAADTVLFTLQFSILKRVIEATSLIEAVAYVVGSLLGTLAGMLYTKGLKDHEE